MRKLYAAMFVTVAFAGIATAGYLFSRKALRANVHAIDGIPANAFLVLTVDVDALRRSALSSPIFGGAASKLAGEKNLTDLCGFDPLTRMREIAVAVPEEGETGEFGIAIRADVSKDELLGCARKVIESRQAHAEGAPTIRTSGSYTLIEPDSVSADPIHRYPTLAYRDGGPFLIGRGSWLASMVDTVDGKLPSVRTNPEHASLREQVGASSASAAGTPTRTGDKGDAVVITAILPKGLRERVKVEMGAELGVDADGHGGESGASMLMAGILGVGSVGAGLAAGTGTDDSSVTLVLRCEDREGCGAVEKLIAKKRLEWSQQLAIRLLGVGAALDSMKIENQGATLRVTLRAASDDVAKWLERVLTLRGVHHPMPSGPLMPSPRTPAPGPSADEVLKPGR